MGVEKTLFEFHLDTFLSDEQDLDNVFHSIKAVNSVIKRYEAFFKTKSLFFIVHNLTKNSLRVITRGEAVTCVNPHNFICLWGMYYSPDTEIFYANKSDIGAIPILSLTTLEKRLQFKIRNDFFKKALAYKISGNIANFFETEDDEDVDNFQLLISCLQNSLQENQVDINQVKKTLMDAVFVCTLLINNLRRFLFLTEDWQTNFKLYGISASFDVPLSQYDSDSEHYNKILNYVNRVELSDYFIQQSPSLDSMTEDAFQGLISPIKDLMGEEAFNKAISVQSPIDPNKINFGHEFKARVNIYNTLNIKKFSVIFNKISKRLMKEVV